jgi:hypothetical protein
MKAMGQSRREFLLSMAGFGGLILCGAAKLALPDYAAPLRSALAFLAARQSRDGAWRSDHYGAFRDGDALTPLVLWAVQTAPRLMAPGGMFARGIRWMERWTDAQVKDEDSSARYPLFAASYAAQVFASAGDKSRAAFCAAMIERLRVSGALGWPASDPACGAWGDSPFPPRLPRDIHPPPDMLAPNLSATLLGVRALAAGDRAAKLADARPFIESCQNFAAVPASEFDDGGFVFAPDDSVRNKAGAAGHCRSRPLSFLRQRDLRRLAGSGRLRAAARSSADGRGGRMAPAALRRNGANGPMDGWEGGGQGIAGLLLCAGLFRYARRARGSSRFPLLGCHSAAPAGFGLSRAAA